MPSPTRTLSGRSRKLSTLTSGAASKPSSARARRSPCFTNPRVACRMIHWRSGPDDPDAVEVTPLAKFEWLSGLIVVPPGTWPE